MNFLVLKPKFRQGLDNGLLDQAAIWRWLSENSGLEKHHLSQIKELKFNVKPGNCIMIELWEQFDSGMMAQEIFSKGTCFVNLAAPTSNDEMNKPVQMKCQVFPCTKVHRRRAWLVDEMECFDFDESKAVNYYNNQFGDEGVVVSVYWPQEDNCGFSYNGSVLLMVPESKSDHAESEKYITLKDGTRATFNLS